MECHWHLPTDSLDYFTASGTVNMVWLGEKYQFTLRLNPHIIILSSSLNSSLLICRYKTFACHSDSTSRKITDKVVCQ